MSGKKILLFFIALSLGIAVVFITRGNPWAIRASLGITIAGLVLFVSEPVPLPQTALLLLILLSTSKITPLATVFSGFSSPSVILITAGFFMAKGVNNTTLMQRITYYFLLKSGGTPHRSLLAILLLLQIMAFFIPASAVKLTLLLPVILKLTDSLPIGPSNIKTSLLLGLAYGVNITSVGLLPGALANIVAADFIGRYTGTTITYLQWMFYCLPFSMLLIPVTWKILLWLFPPEKDIHPWSCQSLEESLLSLGPMSLKDKKCMAILAITIILWLTESFHGWHSSVPAMIAVFLMTLPGLGIIKWSKALDISWGTVILAGTNISLGTVLIITGSSAFLASLLFPPEASAYIFSNIFVAILFLAIFTQVFHKVLGNVVTLVITLLPVVLEVSHRISGNILLLGLVLTISAVCGFMLVIESLPNVIVYNTGLVTRWDFLRAGGVLTLAVILGILVMSITWWPLLGLL